MGLSVRVLQYSAQCCSEFVVSGWSVADELIECEVIGIGSQWQVVVAIYYGL
jgi:hypothetical protein